MARLPPQSTLLLTIGEIDCRPDEGIIPAWKKLSAKSLEDVAQDTSGEFVKYVSGMAARHGHQLIISGVPATNIQLDKLSADAGKQLVSLIRLFNASLKNQVVAAGLEFLDVYALTNSGDGIASGEWHIDQYHLLSSAIVVAFSRHLIH